MSGVETALSWETVLRDEFGAEDGSFLIQLRINLEWDRAAFTRLAIAMEACCKAAEGDETLLRWLAEGFWYVPTFTRDWTSHEAWQATLDADPAYYDACRERLDDLAYWFFIGESPSLVALKPL